MRRGRRAALQEDVLLIAEEKELLGRVQGADVVDYDIDGYVSRLEAILSRKVRRERTVSRSWGAPAVALRRAVAGRVRRAGEPGCARERAADCPVYGAPAPAVHVQGPPRRRGIGVATG